MIVIEFIGLPASGKSTLASALKERVRAAGFPLVVPPRPGSRRLVAKATALVIYRRSLCAVVKALAVDSRPLGQRLLALRWILTSMAARTVTPAEAEGHVLIQAEGFAQRALLTFLDVQTGRTDPRLLAEYLESCPRPDVLVVVELDSAASVERQIVRRANSPAVRRADRFQIPESHLASVMASAGDVLGRAASELGSADDVEVVTLDANDLERAALELGDQIVRVLRARTRGRR